MEFKPKSPAYRSDSLAIWYAKDKKGKKYLKIKVFGGKAVNCFAPISK